MSTKREKELSEINKIKNHVKKLIDDRGFSYNSLSIQFGKNSSYLQKFVKEKSPKRLDEEFRIKLARALDIDEQELTDLPINRHNNESDKEDRNVVSIDVLDVTACCGKGIDNFAENVVGQQLMTLSALHELTTVSHKNIKILKTTGDSMLPTISPNDSLWVDISCKSFVGDSLYLLCVHNSLMVKRLQYNLSDNSITVKSDNPEYNDNNIKDIYSLEIVGKVIYHIKKVG